MLETFIENTHYTQETKNTMIICCIQFLLHKRYKQTQLSIISFSHFKISFQTFSRQLSNSAHSMQGGQISLKLGMQLQNFIHFHTNTQNKDNETIRNHYRVETTKYMGNFHWLKKCRERGIAILKVRLGLIG